MATEVEARSALLSLTAEAVRSGHFGTDLAQRDLNIALQDLESFERAVSALGAVPVVSKHYGSAAARELVLEFAHKVCSGLKDAVFDDAAFDELWGTFLEEVSQPTWNYIGVAHLQNFETDFMPLELCDGVGIQLNPNEIQSLMGWTGAEWDLFQQESREIMASHYSMVIRDQVAKAESNARQIAWEGLWKKANLVLRALRLLKTGDVRIGRVWLAQPASFSVLQSGMQSVGTSMIRPGATYYLAASDHPSVAETYKLLRDFESSQESLSKSKLEELPNFDFAFRAFDAIYERQIFRTEDQIVDAITALEALFGIKGEQSYRMALRTSGLIASSDQERFELFEKMRDHYDTRSAIVHGKKRSEKQKRIIQDNGPLREIAQRLLLGFLRLAPSEQSDIQLWKGLDGVILHSRRREELRRRMGLTEAEDMTRQRAYELYEARGMADGSAQQDWLKAEAEVLAAREERNKSFLQRLFNMASKGGLHFSNPQAASEEPVGEP